MTHREYKYHYGSKRKTVKLHMVRNSALDGGMPNDTGKPIIKTIKLKL